jgi:sugar-specific transcriptional regulator TrmB
VAASAEESLRTVGMSQYEARVYLALLRGGEQNGHELSKNAGIPSSKVYGVLDKLGEAGVVQQVRRGGSSTYVPLPPQELTARLRDRFVTSIETLESELPRMASGAAPSEILTVAGWNAVLAEARRVIDGAARELYVSLRPEALEELRVAIDAAGARGVDIFGMLYGEAEPPAGTWERHTHLEIVHARVGGHMLTLAADGSDALLAHVPDDGEALAVRTQNPVICLVADEYLRHELVLQQAQRATGDQRWDAWWSGDPQVRSVMLGRALLARDAEAPSQP